ncbi:MAG: ATP-binding cassette domain-containing protein [Comamonadaceae bacterium]|nr:MAG: ATP-binding cassette domain-containing protein [Comamonadaceae bacterium]
MIRTQALVFSHGALAGPALRFPDVDVPQAGRLLLRGPSGAGKSTWLALVAGLRTPGQGSVQVAGQDLQALSNTQRDTWRARHIGFLPQRLHLSAALTVAGNLAMPFFAAGLPRDGAAIAQALQRLGVQSLEARRPHQLSGGQAQRVALARAVLLSPKVLLADEPTASLDDEAAQAALQLLDDCAARCGATLVVATHDGRAVQWLLQRSGTQTLQLEGGSLETRRPPEPERADMQRSMGQA